MKPAAALAMQAHLEKLAGEGDPRHLRRPTSGVSRRDQITLSPEEQLELLDEERVVSSPAIGPRGWPHSMPMWFVVRDGDIWCWTYGKSQKIKNLERDPRATLLVEAGHEYQELRGIQIEAEAELIRDTDAGRRVRQAADPALRRRARRAAEDAEAALRAQAPKRVAMHFKPVRTATWDHRKLGGTY